MQVNCFLPALATCLLIVACVSAPPPVAGCGNADLQFDSHFDGGNLHACDIVASSEISVELRPEDADINPSPWYAFRISTATQDELTVHLDFGTFPARYWPKISRDGHHWQAMDESDVRLDDDGHGMRLHIRQPAPQTWISAQELVTSNWYELWQAALAARDDIGIRWAGSSVEGRPLVAAQTPNRPEFLVLLGRHHPPEISGALAMRPFIDTLLDDTPLARRFRQRYQLFMLPLMNPDGVAHGHWRHNVNGVDLNRDWGPFSQPETRNVNALITELVAAGGRPVLMLDFHSTRSSLFYTQLPGDFGQQPDFATSWLSSARTRLPDYEFEHAARKQSMQANTKNYFFRTYDIPAITYELGDEVARDDIARSSHIFAEEMMRLLLERPPLN